MSISKNFGNYAIRGKSSLIGIKITEKVKKAISLSHKGKHTSIDTEFKSGNEHPMYGKNLPKEWKNNISKGNKGKKKPIRTEIHRRNMSKAIENSWKTGRLKLNNGCFKKGNITWSTGLTKETDNRIKRYCEKYRSKQILPKTDTTIEIKVQNFLKKLGIEFFTHQYMKEIKHGYQCDILIPSINLVIECDGNYWHKYPIGNELDHIRTKELLEKGFKILRLWEFEIRSMKLNDFNSRLKEYEVTTTIA